MRTVNTQKKRTKLTAYQVQQIRDLNRLAARGVTTQRAIAAHFGLSQATVSDICSRKLWADEPDIPVARLLPASLPKLKADLSAGGRIGGPSGVFVCFLPNTAFDVEGVVGGDDDDEDQPLSA